MRAILAGFALTTFFVTPTFADYYIVQEPTTKRCRIVEERPAPGVGVVIGGIGSACAQKRKAECAPNAERRPAATSLLRSVNVARRDDVRRSRWIRMAWVPSGGTRRDPEIVRRAKLCSASVTRERSALRASSRD